MKIAVRADASTVSGSGHLMRCLTLADALRDQGAQVRFLCSELPIHLAALVRRNGHQLVMLTPPCASSKIGTSAEAPWTASAEQADAQETVAALAGSGRWDWIVVDHYGLSAHWEQAVHPVTHRLFALDDLGRRHDCDVLLDANFIPDAAARYVGRLPATTTMLLGPAYALLRPEFLAARHNLQARTGPVRRLLVLLGGMDASNATVTVLEAIAAINKPQLEVDVVVGATHPALAQIKQMAAHTPLLHCHVQTDKVAQLCAAADLAIGAGGGSTWERCALGLPTLGLCLAENQRAALEAGARHGFLYHPNGPVHDAASIARHLAALLDNDGLREHMSRRAMELVDAQGLQRVASLMLRSPVAMRRATPADSRMLLGWRNAPEVRKASRITGEIAWAAHQRWLQQVLADPTRMLLIGERASQPVGVVRFDCAADGSAEVSIHVAPDSHGQGDGSALLLASQDWLRREYPDISHLTAEVLKDNGPSHRLFARAGYTRQNTRYAKRI